MKLKEVRANYAALSGLASNSARQLAFAGIAVVWIMATQSATQIHDPTVLRLPLLIFVGALAADLLQYYSGALLWGWFQRNREKKHGNTNEELEVGSAHRAINWPALLFFWSKGVAVALGYLELAKILLPVLLK